LEFFSKKFSKNSQVYIKGKRKTYISPKISPKSFVERTDKICGNKNQ
jgi:hypothetical protein